MSYMAPKRESRIAAHRAPKVRMRDRVRVIVFAVHMGVWACWQYNRRLFWQLTMVFAGVACLLAALVTMLLGLMFQ